MAIIIGGSPSTGSSLLRRILNRNTKVFCGGETAIFTKEDLYMDWNGNKTKLLSRSFAGLTSMGWHHLNGVTLPKEYNLQTADIQQLIKDSSSSFTEFVSHFFEPALEASGKELWAEKTPGNAYAFKYFLGLFEKGKVIHTVRNPFDTISSLHNRGISVLDACALYLLNSSSGLTVSDDSRYMSVKYEDLVSGNKDVIFDLCHFLGIEFESAMLDEEQSDGDDYMEGWMYKETGKIQKGSIGRFDRLDEDTKNEIINTASMLKSKFASHKTVFNVGEALRYRNLPEMNTDPVLRSRLLRELAKDKLIRTAKGAYFNMTNYPVYIE